MTSNVACSTPGCTNPVVGQCGGYNSKCGRFYCTEHSTSYSSGTVLCSVCAERAEIQRIYEDYLETAKQIKSPGGCVWLVIITIIPFYIAFFLLAYIAHVLENFGYIAMNHDSANDVFLGIIICLGVIWFFVINSWRKTKIKEKLDEIDKEKPGFKDFYTAWKSNQEKEASQLVGALALGAFLATGEEVVRRERLRSDVRIIKDEWRKP